MRIKRIALVTAGLMAAGAVFGTVVGAVVLLAWLASIGDLRSAAHDPLFMVELAVAFGGVPGAVLGPLAAWGLMRHVPLWLAVGGPTLGTLVCGGLGLLATGDPVAGMLWGILGFAGTAVSLRLHAPSDQRRLPAG